ncbi:hypothetical protein Tco_0731426 [Tanacetum coccineum]
MCCMTPLAALRLTEEKERPCALIFDHGGVKVVLILSRTWCIKRVFQVEENLHITFLENKPNIAGKGPTWLFDLDYLTDSMNYQPVRSENQANKHEGPQEANHNAGTEDIINAGDSKKEDESAQDCFVLPIWSSYSLTITPDLKTDAKREGPREEEQVFLDELERLKSTVSTPAKASSGIFTHSSYDDEGAVADFINLETVVTVSPIPTSRIISSHPSALILGDPTSVVQTRSKVNKSSGAHAFVSYVQKQRRNNYKDFQHCLFACFLSKINQEDFRGGWGGGLLPLPLCSLEEKVGLSYVKKKLLAIQDLESFGYLYFAFWEEG